MSAFARTVYIGGRGDVLMASATTITELKTSLTTKRIPASHRERRGPIGKTIKRIGAWLELKKKYESEGSK